MSLYGFVLYIIQYEAVGVFCFAYYFIIFVWFLILSVFNIIFVPNSSDNVSVK